MEILSPGQVAEQFEQLNKNRTPITDIYRNSNSPDNYDNLAKRHGYSKEESDWAYQELQRKYEER